MNVSRHLSNRGARRRAQPILCVWLVATVLPASFAVRNALAQSPEGSGRRHEPFINKIIIEGNAFFSDKDLKGQMRTKESTFFSIFHKPRLDVDKLGRDIASLEAYYHASGFLEATVELERIADIPDEPFVNIIIRVTENQPTRVDQITFRGTVIEENELGKLLLLKPGVPFNPSSLVSDLATMKRRYYEEGFLAVEIQDSVSVNDRRVEIQYRFDPGPVITIGDIEIRGNSETKTSLIEDEVTFESGEVFNLKEVVETQRNLFETGFFTEADVIPGDPDLETRTVDLVIRVRERKSAYIEAGFGVGNILGSRVFGEWGDRNFVGTGRLLRFKVEYSFGLFEPGRFFDFGRTDPRVTYYRYDVEFFQRRVLGLKLGLGLNGFLEKDATVENIVIRTRGGSVGGNRRISRNANVLLGFTQERIERSAPDTVSQSTSHIVSAGISHDTRDFILDPRTGGYRDLNVGVGGGILGGDNDFYQIRTGVQRYFRWKSSWVFALRARLGYADFYGNSVEVPIEQRFFTGGGNSVRGYDENSLGPRASSTDSDGNPIVTVVGGRLLLLGNAEVRFPFPLLAKYNFSGAVFADGGNVWASPGDVRLEHFRFYADRSDVTQEDFRYSIGLGIRYNTPVGPIRLDYGYPLKVEEGWDSGARFHISLGQIF